MKKILILFSMLITLNSFAMKEFSKSEQVKASDFNNNFQIVKDILQSEKNTPINFILFNSGELIDKDLLNQEIAKVSQLGIEVPQIENEKITSEELNNIFSLMILGITSYNDIPILYDINLDTIEDQFFETDILYLNNVGVLSFSLMDSPQNGNISFIGNKIRYTPNPNFHGSDSFSFRAFDGTHYSNLITKTMTVTSVNDAPVSVSKSLELDEDTQLAIQLESFDVENEVLNYSITSQPQNGILTGNPPNITYIPNINFFGTDSFSFKTSDGVLDSNIAKISLTINSVNDIPQISGSNIVLNQNSFVSSSISVEDEDSAIFTYHIVTPPAKGTISWGINGAYTYTANLNTFGSDSFIVRVSDGLNFSDNLTINVQINASGIIITSGVRTYFDGSSPTSCRVYKNQNNGNYSYTGAVGSGYYSIKPDSGAPFTAYCDMVTDNGGWTLVLRQHNATMALATTAAVSAGNVHLRNANAKYTDAMIRTIARSGSLEALIEYNTSNKYIFRYSDAEWNNYSSVGWTNVQYDAKNSAGNWVNNTCNGHVNNRGFSTYSDSAGATCATIYQGSRYYFTPYHTSGWNNVSHKSPTNVFVR